MEERHKNKKSRWKEDEKNAFVGDNYTHGVS
jgi:hypothetical protein